MSCPTCGSPFDGSHFGDCPDATVAPAPAPLPSKNDFGLQQLRDMVSTYATSQLGKVSNWALGEINRLERARDVWRAKAEHWDHTESRLRAALDDAREGLSAIANAPGDLSAASLQAMARQWLEPERPAVETSAKPPCDHPLGKLFYHGFVSGRPGDFRCDACQAVIYLPSLKAREWAAARIEMQQQSKTSGTQNAASGHECQHCKQLNADWAKWCGRCGGSLRD